MKVSEIMVTELNSGELLIYDQEIFTLNYILNSQMTKIQFSKVQ